MDATTAEQLKCSQILTQRRAVFHPQSGHIIFYSGKASIQILTRLVLFLKIDSSSWDEKSQAGIQTINTNL